MRIGGVRGARAVLSCRGKRCFAAVRRSFARKQTVDLVKSIPKKKRRLGPGSVVTLRLTEPNAVGKLLKITFRRNKEPLAKAGCLAPNSNRAVKCP
jgi:hypothetical protein